MSKRWKELVKVIETWPSERQEDAAEMLSLLVEQGPQVYKLSDDERAAIAESRAQLARGELATEEDVIALLRKHSV